MSTAINEQQLDRLTSHIRQRIAQLKQLHVPGGPPELQHDDQDAELFLRNCAAIDHQVLAQATREVTRLRDNLDWLASDEAGLCTECSSAIPFARLLAVPSTRLCVTCAQHLTS